MDEETLLTRLVSGNDRDAEKAFNDLVAIVRPRLLKYLSGMTTSSAEREDVAQDTLLTLWSVRRRFRYQGVQQFYAWFYLTARRKLIDLIRTRTSDDDLGDLADEDDRLDDSSDLEAVLWCSNVLWLGLPKQATNEEHFRMLLAAQFFYVDRQPWPDVIRLLGGNVSREMLDQWLADSGVLRYLVFQQVYFPGERLLWHFIHPDRPFDESAYCDLVIACQSTSTDAKPPEGWSWPEIRFLFLRFCCCIAPEEIADHSGGSISSDGIPILIDRCRENEPFTKQMNAALRAIAGAPNASPGDIGSRGLWQRLAFQYRYYDELPHKDIHERVSPAATAAGYTEFTPGALNVWLSNHRLIQQVQRCVQEREQ